MLLHGFKKIKEKNMQVCVVFYTENFVDVNQ